ncbi:hypothetical protein ACH5RR_007101 [Cinchona calisaya]|uniref:Uncharacterized protein n=1 Tax=Cinchona calisaya TaxID=153742 RepID=A0ABD3AQW3_9GENT
MIKGFLTSYTNWIYHGEEPWEFGQQNTSNIICETDEEDDMQGLTHDAFGNINFTSAIHGIEEDFDFRLELENDVACDEETTNFFKWLKHVEAELYKGFHDNEVFPSSYRDAWKIVKDLGLSYKKVEKLETSSNDNDYHKEISYLATGPDKWVRNMQNKDGLSKHCNNDYSDDEIFTWVREGVDGVTLNVPTPKSSMNIIQCGFGGDDFIEDDEYSSSEDDLGCDNTHAKSHHLKSKPNQIPLSDHSKQPHSKPGSDSSSDSEATKGGFDGPMEDDSSSEDGANSGRGLVKRSNTWGTGIKLQLDWNESHQVIGPNARANLNEELQKLPETTMIDNTVKDSIHEKIIGPEKPGRMRTYGMGPIPKDIRISNHMSVAQKQAFDDIVNERIEAMRIQMSAEMHVKLCRFEDDLISHFEERIRNFAPLQREMTPPQESLLRGSFEVGDGINNQAEENDDEVNKQSEKIDSSRVQRSSKKIDDPQLHTFSGFAAKLTKSQAQRITVHCPSVSEYPGWSKSSLITFTSYKQPSAGITLTFELTLSVQ